MAKKAQAEAVEVAPQEVAVKTAPKKPTKHISIIYNMLSHDISLSLSMRYLFSSSINS